MSHILVRKSNNFINFPHFLVRGHTFSYFAIFKPTNQHTKLRSLKIYLVVEHVLFKSY